MLKIPYGISGFERMRKERETLIFRYGRGGRRARYVL